jgi:hypothetical protein
MEDFVAEAKAKPQKPGPQSRKPTPRQNKPGEVKETSSAASNLYQSQLSTDGNTVNSADALARLLATSSLKHGVDMQDPAGLDTNDPTFQSELAEKVSEEIEEEEESRGKAGNNQEENIEDSSNIEPRTNVETNVNK